MFRVRRVLLWWFACALVWPVGFRHTLSAEPLGQAAAEEDLRAKARRIHDRAITLDSHVDIAGAQYATPQLDPGTDHPRLKCDLVKMAAGGVDGVFLAAFVPQQARDADGYRRAYQTAMEKISAIRRLATTMYPDRCELATTPDEVERIAAGGKRAIMIGIENGYAVGTDLSNVGRFYDLGVRYITFCHNGHNQLCDSCNPAPTLGDQEAEHRGLSPLGRQVVAEMNRLGMMIDVSHAAPSSFRDVVALNATVELVRRGYTAEAIAKIWGGNLLRVWREVQATAVRQRCEVVPPRILGIFGGMGPEATANLYREIVRLTRASKDQDHIPTLIYSFPQVPDRTAAIQNRDRSIVPYLVEGVSRLERAGASLIVIPCNTAHYFYDDMQQAVQIPIIHMIRETADAVVARHPGCKTIGLLATSGTIQSGLYEKEFRARGLSVVLPDRLRCRWSMPPGCWPKPPSGHTPSSCCGQPRSRVGMDIASRLCPSTEP